MVRLTRTIKRASRLATAVDLTAGISKYSSGLSIQEENSLAEVLRYLALLCELGAPVAQLVRVSA